MYYLRLPFLGMALLLLLNSCERHSIIEPLDPHQDLKQWYAFSRITHTNEPVLWNYTTPFTMPDGSQAFQIPVMSKVGMKDLIIYSENGVQKGFYKWYTPKDETHINVQVLNMFDEVIRDGILTKTKKVSNPRKKIKNLENSIPKMANLDLDEVFCYGERTRPPMTHDELIAIYRNNLGNYDSAIPAFFEGGGGESGTEEEIMIKRFPNTKDYAGGLIYTGLQETELFNKLNENTQNYIKTIIYNFKDGNNGTYCK